MLLTAEVAVTKNWSDNHKGAGRVKPVHAPRKPGKQASAVIGSDLTEGSQNQVPMKIGGDSGVEKATSQNGKLLGTQVSAGVGAVKTEVLNSQVLANMGVQGEHSGTASKGKLAKMELDWMLRSADQDTLGGQPWLTGWELEEVTSDEPDSSPARSSD